MPLLFVTYFISATCFSEVSRCLQSYCNLLFTGGDSRVLAGHRLISGSFPPPSISICSPCVLLSSFTLSHLLSKDISTQHLFQAEAPMLPTCLAEKNPVALSPPPLLLWQQTSQALAAQMEDRKCLWKPGKCHRGLYLKFAAVSILRWLI